MTTVNYRQRVGHASCVRCDYVTRDEMSFEEQDAAMMKHLEEKHPNWMLEPLGEVGGMNANRHRRTAIHPRQ